MLHVHSFGSIVKDFSVEFVGVNVIILYILFSYASIIKTKSSEDLKFLSKR